MSSAPPHRGGAGTDGGRASWEELQRTAALVCAPAAAPHGGGSASAAGGRRLREKLLVGAVTCAVGVAVAWRGAPAPVLADATADQDLFSLTNQDRASNGLPALQWHSLLGAIGENKPYGGCGFTVYGRSQDMITRNYFAHPILNCGGQLVFNMMSADGINYRLAGENIGWASGAGDAGSSASYINQQFMNSPEHRSNILQSGFTHLGVGSILSPSGYNWTGSGSAVQNVWMFSEEFAGLSSAPPPPAPAPVATAPPPTSAAHGSTTTTPSTPQPTPAQTAPPTPPPTPTPLPTPTPTPTPVPAPNLGAPQPPLLYSGGGLIADSIQAVLEAFLFD